MDGIEAVVGRWSQHFAEPWRTGSESEHLIGNPMFRVRFDHKDARLGFTRGEYAEFCRHLGSVRSVFHWADTDSETASFGRRRIVSESSD
jgi:hypothetical protein